MATAFGRGAAILAILFLAALAGEPPMVMPHANLAASGRTVSAPSVYDPAFPRLDLPSPLALGTSDNRRVGQEVVGNPPSILAGVELDTTLTLGRGDQTLSLNVLGADVNQS